jgi:hypothetical protein
MMTGALLYRTLETMVRESKETKVPEPEFKPFRFPQKEAVATPIRSITPANVTREPRTLEELGVPRTLAHDLEATLRVMGATRGDRVVGYTFRAADGASYELCTSGVAGRSEADLAA